MSRRATQVCGLLGLAVLLLAGCSSASTTEDVRLARAQLDLLHLKDLGPVVGEGSFGSAGLSGSRPTAFIAIRTDTSPEALMTIIGDRMQRAGFSPFVPCRPPDTCTWRRTADKKLRTAYALVLHAGQPWGGKSTAHGTVAPDTRLLQVEMIVGG